MLFYTLLSVLCISVHMNTVNILNLKVQCVIFFTNGNSAEITHYTLKTLKMNKTEDWEYYEQEFILTDFAAVYERGRKPPQALYNVLCSISLINP